MLDSGRLKSKDSQEVVLLYVQVGAENSNKRGYNKLKESSILKKGTREEFWNKFGFGSCPKLWSMEKYAEYEL